MNIIFRIYLLLNLLFFCFLGCDRGQSKSQQSNATQPPTKQSVSPVETPPRIEPALQEEEVIDVAEDKLARNFYFVFDGSGSMKGTVGAGNFPNKISAAKSATLEFIKSLKESDQIGLYVFDSYGKREVLEIGKNLQEFRDLIQRVKAGGNTPLTQSVDRGVKSLDYQKKRQLGYGEYNIVVVTDGEADDKETLAQAVEKANDKGILIHTIGFSLKGKDHSLKTGSYSFRTADNPEELREAVVSVLAEEEYFDPDVFEPSP